MTNSLINIAIYQLIWFSAVLWEDPGGLLALPLLGLHLLLSRKRRADLEMMGLLLAAGLLIDGALHANGIIAFNSAAKPIPLWLAVIWLGLAILPHHSLAWMQRRHLLSALFGALGGPLAYWAGVRLGAASFPLGPGPALGILSVIWAILWPCVMYFAVRYASDQPQLRQSR